MQRIQPADPGSITGEPESQPGCGAPAAAGPAGARIMVVDDEPTIRKVVQAYLEKEGYQVIVVGDGLAAWDEFQKSCGGQRLDLVILDLMLPGLSGWELCRRMQASDPDLAVIMLTARGEETDRIVGLRLGADDYVSKPFSPAELVARVQAVLRRRERATATGQATAAVLRFGPLVIDPTAFRAWVNDRPVDLTATEFRMLLALARRPQQVFTRGQLLEAAGGDSFSGYERNVDTHIKNIRRKLAEAGLAEPPIETVYRVGYRFRPAPLPGPRSGS